MGVAIVPPQVTAFILAGGKSTRMGADKPFVQFNGKTLLSRALEIAGELTEDVRIVGSYEKFSPYAPVVEDVFRECGPLGGIHAALQASSTDLNLMLGVDMPFVSAPFLRYLVAQAHNASDLAVVPYSGERFQPLCAVYPREFWKAAETALLAGQNRIGLLFKTVPIRVIDEDELVRSGFSPALFRSLNTPEELQAASE
jgi:molybdopterin-guanine dinucleotide biosynthesis protein A